MEGCPVNVGISFRCNGNQLSTLEGCPIRVGRNFDCSNNAICESELFLYGYSYADIKNYYDKKNLNEKLSVELNEQVDLVKKNKI